MAVILDLNYTERNDNRVLTLQDTTVWGGTELETTEITTLTLDITIVESNSTETVYDQIDLVAEFGQGSPEFPTQADLAFPIDCTYLKVNDVEIGTALDEIPDGIWTLTYILDESLGTEVSFTEDILVEGEIRAAVYEKLRALPTIYNCSECKTKEIMDTIFCYGLLNTMESSGYVAMNEELINQMYVLERLVTNGSSYTW